MTRAFPILAGLLLGISSTVAQVVVPTGLQQTGCSTPPISFQITNAGGSVTFQPIPAGYGNVVGFYLILFPSWGPLPPVRQLLPWGSAPWAPCCYPGPAIMYEFTTSVLSPVESWTIPVPAGLVGFQAWVQGLLHRGPIGVPCQTYVTNQVEVRFQ